MPSSSSRSPHPTAGSVRVLALAVLVLGVGLGVTPAAVVAQGASPAVLLGTVTDGSGSPLEGAEVTAVRAGSEVERSTTTRPDGRYVLPGLESGDYTVRVSAFGFRVEERRAVRLGPGSSEVLDFRLELDPLAVEDVRVEVSSEPRFERTRTGTGTTLTEAEIRAVPTVERSMVRLAELSPVVSTTRSGGLSISGQNARYNAVMIDGALHQDHFGATAGGVPGSEAGARALPMDAVRDFQVEAAPYDVRRSGFTGGLLNAVTRRGGDRWEGSVGAEYRDERFFGELAVDGTDLTPASYRKQVFSATLGGPIVADRLHLFLAGEIDGREQPPLGYSLGPGNPLHTRVQPDSAARMAAVLRDGYGLEPGDAGSYGLNQESGNLFARVDWRLSDRHMLTSHLNLVSAGRDVPANRTPVGSYGFSSSGYRMTSVTMGAMARLLSRLDHGLENELTVNVQRTRDRREPASSFPQVDVAVRSSFDGWVLQRTLRAGAGYLDQRSDLEQAVAQVSDALTWERGDVATTFGAGVDLLRFRRDYLPGSLGYHRFDDLAALDSNRPSYYEVRVPVGGDDPATRFSVAQPSFLVQNRHRFPDGLILYYGIRGDVPLFLTKPSYNEAIDSAFDRRTDRLPSGQVLLSPRLGVNWQSDRRYLTQIRGGGGVFTGRLPYVWLANAYADDGLRTRVLACRGFDAPPLSTGAAPTECADGAGVEEAGRGNVVVFDPEFRAPREIKASLAIDQRLPLGLVASAEVLLVQTLSQVILRDLNLVGGGPQDERYHAMVGQRTQFGTPTLPTGYIPRRRLEGYDHVLEMANESSSGFAHSITLGLEGRFGDHVTLAGSYSFNHSDDTQSLTWGDALLNFATNPSARDPNDLSRQTSAFQRPWKAVGSGTVRLPESWTGGTQLSVLYVGEAGLPYSYVYADDVNGDGYPGPGIQLDESNDLLYVPNDVGTLRATPATTMLLEQLFLLEPCLREARGGILRRNACRAPAAHRLDAKLTQPLRFGRYGMELTASLLNVLNLLDPEWGRVVDVPSLVPVLALHGRVPKRLYSGAPDPNAPLVVRYVGPVARDTEEGRLTASLPHSVRVPESQWQAQVGLRFTF
jgi:hypothetical protein